jgi:hypothetical protein
MYYKIANTFLWQTLQHSLQYGVPNWIMPGSKTRDIESEAKLLATYFALTFLSLSTKSSVIQIPVAAFAGSKETNTG